MRKKTELEGELTFSPPLLIVGFVKSTDGQRQPPLKTRLTPDSGPM